MALEIRIDDSRVNELLGILQNIDLAPLSATAAEFVATRGTRAFRDETLRPSPWDPLSQKYEQRLKNKFSAGVSKMRSKKQRAAATFEHQLLIDTDALRRSIKAFEVGQKTASGGYVARVASDREYAAYHQFGTKHMPARPFLPISANLQTGTAVLTDEAWNVLKPALERTLKRIIKS